MTSCQNNDQSMKFKDPVEMNPVVGFVPNEIFKTVDDNPQKRGLA